MAVPTMAAALNIITAPAAPARKCRGNPQKKCPAAVLGDILINRYFVLAGVRSKVKHWDLHDTCIGPCNFRS